MLFAAFDSLASLPAKSPNVGAVQLVQNQHYTSQVLRNGDRREPPLCPRLFHGNKALSFPNSYRQEVLLFSFYYAILLDGKLKNAVGFMSPWRIYVSILPR